jgi:phospholipase/carboxylesterase
MRRLRVADLDVVLAGGPDREGGGDGPLLVLLHGYGAPGDDLVPLWRELEVERDVRFAFPAAPDAMGGGTGMPGGGRAWWQIDMLELQRTVMFRDFEAGTRRVPEGLAEARNRIQALLAALEADFSAPASRLVLGGFSQGAMLATDVALRSAESPAGLVVLSGTLLARDEWLPLMPSKAGLPVLQSHGRADPILPFEVAQQLEHELRRAGLQVEFHASNGGHGIPAGVMSALGKFMGRIKR